MNKITIIGSGSVGSTIAYTLTVQGIASEIVMIDINEEKAKGEALDIRQGVPFCTPCSVYAGSYEDAKDSDIVIITSGIARKPGQTRLDLAQTNVNIIKSITPNITKYAPDAIYLFVSNPVDILTYTFCKCSGIPESRILGSGTILDTARLRARLSEYYQINQQNVHAYVLGEHGDSSFVPWSVANISNIPANAYQKAMENTDGMLIPPLNYADVEDAQVRRQRHQAQGRNVLCGFHFRLPYRKVHPLRHRYQHDGFYHAERRIRYQRCLPEPAHHRRPQGCCE